MTQYRVNSRDPKQWMGVDSSPDYASSGFGVVQDIHKERALKALADRVEQRKAQAAKASVIWTQSGLIAWIARWLSPRKRSR